MEGEQNDELGDRFVAAPGPEITTESEPGRDRQRSGLLERGDSTCPGAVVTLRPPG